MRRTFEYGEDSCLEYSRCAHPGWQIDSEQADTPDSLPVVDAEDYDRVLSVLRDIAAGGEPWSASRARAILRVAV